MEEKSLHAIYTMLLCYAMGFMSKIVRVFYDDDAGRDSCIEMLPERRLAAAVIVRAVLDSRGQISGTADHKNLVKHIIRDAKNWLYFDNGQDEPGSFSWCCYILCKRPSFVLESIDKFPDIASLKLWIYSQVRGSRGGVRY